MKSFDLNSKEMMAIPLKDRKIKVYKTTSNRLN